MCVARCTWSGVVRPRPDNRSYWYEQSSKEHPGNGKRCPYCQRIMHWENFNLRPTVDHRIPRALGGPNRAENRLTVCFSCNNSKANYRLLEWLMLLAQRGDWRVPMLMAFIEAHEPSRTELDAARAAMAG